MLDLRFLRENPEVVKQNIRNKFQDSKLPLVDEVIELDAESRATKQEADDLRAGAALIIAGLVATGETEISSINYIERGYEEIIDKFRAIGADIRKQYVPDEEVATTA